MPEPIKSTIVQRRSRSLESELISVSFNLSRSSRYIHDSVEYKFDIDEYRIRTDRGRFHYLEAQNNYDNGIISKEELDEIANIYFTFMCTYYLVDEDGKECGKYNTMTREYEIYYKRIIIDGRVYYCDSNNQVTTYANSNVGRLSSNGSVIVRYEMI